MNTETTMIDEQCQITRVLLIEDNPGEARLIQEMVAETGGNRFLLERPL